MSDAIVYLDFETTGFEPVDGRILEVGALGPLSGRTYSAFVRAPEFVLASMPARNFHVETGFLAAYMVDCEKHLMVQDVEDTLVRFVIEEISQTEAKRARIAGWSPHFDLAWMSVHMPRLRRLFSHQVLDVSSVAHFISDVGVVLEKHPASHFALADCKQAREYYRIAMETMSSSVRRPKGG